MKGPRFRLAQRQELLFLWWGVLAAWPTRPEGAEYLLADLAESIQEMQRKSTPPPASSMLARFFLRFRRSQATALAKHDPGLT